jgi:uncharacterized membrane protein
MIISILPLAIIFLSFILGAFYYPQLPDQLATHWGINGQVDGYSPKTFALFFMPVLSIFLYLLFRFLPQTDPYKKNFSQFKNHYDNFVVLIFVFLFYIYLLTLFWHLGLRFNMVQSLSPALGALFYYASVLISVAKRNWFVGIRTPWTLSSDKIWNKTHTFGAKLFRLTAVSTLLGTIFPDYAFYLLLIPVLLSTLIVFIYSYIEYQKPPH